MKPVIVLVLVALVIAGLYFHVSHRKEAERLERQATRDATFAEMKLVQAKMDLLNKWIDACNNHSAPTKLDGAYDGFSYGQQADYVQQEKDQEQRYRDLQNRLNSAGDN